jgi:hypothetical protein
MPTFRHGKNVALFIDKYDYSAFFNDMSASDTVETAETTAFGDSSKAYIVGLQDGKVSVKGMFEGTASVAGEGAGTDEYFDAVKGGTTKQKIIVAPEGHFLGARSIVLQADDTSYEVSGAIGAVVMANAEFQSSAGLDHGVILSSGSAVTATGFGTSVDAGVGGNTINGGVAFFSIPTNTRNGTIIIKVQQSADNSTFTDLVSFTTVTSTQKTSERAVVARATTIARYLRVSYTVAGSTGSATPIVAFARR